MRTRIDLQPLSRFLGWEVHCLGRPVVSERFDSGRALLGLEVYREQRPLLIERLRVDGEPSLGGAAGLRDHAVTATLLATPADSEHLALSRQYLASQGDPLAAATLIDELLVVRCLGNNSAWVTSLLRGLWAVLREPLLGVTPCPPRIWAT